VAKRERSPIADGPEGVEGVVAADEPPDGRSPRPARRCTQRRPLTPAGSPSAAAAAAAAAAAVDDEGPLSILYLRNSEIEREQYQPRIQQKN